MGQHLSKQKPRQVHRKPPKLQRLPRLPTTTVPWSVLTAPKCLWQNQSLSDTSSQPSTVTLQQVLALPVALQVKDIHSGQVVTALPWLVTSHPLGATVHLLPVPPHPQLLAVQRLSVTCVVKPLSG